MTNQQMPSTSYLLWYHSNSHKRDRFFIGVTPVKLPDGRLFPKPCWSYSKDESQIFDSLSEVQEAKAHCAVCGYTGLKIEPIDNKPIWTPSELVKVEKPKDAVAPPLKALPLGS